MDNYRYCALFQNDEAVTFSGILEKNGLYLTEVEALSQRDDAGNPPCGLLVLIIKDLRPELAPFSCP